MTFWKRWFKQDATRSPGSKSVSGRAVAFVDSIALARARRMLEAGDGREAVALIFEAMRAGDPPPGVLGLYAAWLARSGRWIEATRAFRAALAKGHADPAFQLEYAAALAALGRYDEAYALAAAVADADSASFAAAVACARYAAGSSRHDAARRLYERALNLRSDEPAAVAGYARSLAACDELAFGLEVAEGYDRQMPDHADVVAAIAHIQNRLGRDGDALASIERLVALVRSGTTEVPSSIIGLHALKLSEVGRLRDAAHLLIDRLRVDPDVELHVQLTFALMGLGCFREAFSRYPVRWFVDSAAGRRPHPERDRWGGLHAVGRSVVVGHEQGIGDLIMFARFVAQLRSKGIDTILVVPVDLLALARQFDGVGRVVASGQPVHGAQAFDRFVSLGDLPARLGADVDSIRCVKPYLSVEPSRRDAWAKRLQDMPRPRIGLVWAGNPGHVRDAERSIPLVQLRPLFAVDSVSFVSLQKGTRAVPSTCEAPTGIEDLSPELHDFVDTCAALEQLDLLITVDTSVAHAAGALGVPTWLLVAMPPDYRWLDAGDSTCWYPSMRIHRQGADRRWEPVIARVVQDLRRWLACEDDNIRPQLLGANDPVRSPVEVPLDGLPDVVETRFGIVQVPPARSVEFESLRAMGEYASVFRDAILDVAQRGQTVLQVGAGAGEAALALSGHLGPDGHVLALENDEYTFRCLRQNIAGNGAGNVTVLASGPGSPWSDCGIDQLALRTLDGIVFCRGFPFARLEDLASRTIWSFRPWVLALLEPDPASTVLTQVLSRFGYRFWSLDVPLFRVASYLGGRSRELEGIERRAILAMPEERPDAPRSPAWREFGPGSGTRSRD